jgi:hypothetical protein
MEIKNQKADLRKNITVYAPYGFSLYVVTVLARSL